MPAPGIAEFRRQDYHAALPLLSASASAGDPEAQCLLGSLFQLGLGGLEANDMEAMQWYYRAANQGHSAATHSLAGMVWAISSEAAAALYQLARQQAVSVPMATGL